MMTKCDDLTIGIVGSGGDDWRAAVAAAGAFAGLGGLVVPGVYDLCRRVECAAATRGDRGGADRSYSGMGVVCAPGRERVVDGADG